MNTPVLSKLQKKLSLSGKKRKKETIKNVLGNPHQTFWPLVDDELNELVTVMQNNLPQVKQEKLNVPWSVLKNVDKGDRKKIRQKYLQNNGVTIENIKKDEKLIFGVNDVTKSLECDSCAAVLIADVNPRILVEHVLDLSVLHNTPVLVLPGLKEILKDNCGLGSMAIAIKKGCDNDSNLSVIAEAINKISRRYPPNNNHINSKRAKFVETFQLPSTSKPKTVTNSTPIKNYHLIKRSSERVFVPEDGNGSIKTENKDFWVFSDADTVDSTKNSRDANSNYKPLVVKKFKANKNRQKEKISKMKRKRKK